MRRLFSIFYVLLSFFLAACSAAPAASSPPATVMPSATATLVPTATILPTATLVPTPMPQIATGVFVAGIDVGGKTADQALILLEQELAEVVRPIDIRAEKAQITLQAEEIGLQLDTDSMLAEAITAKAGAKIPLKISIDQTLLEQQLQDLATQVNQPGEVTLITTTRTISRSFVITGGLQLDIEAATRQIERQLQSVGAPRRMTLSLSPVSAANTRPTPAQLQEQIEAMAKRWNGIVGVYVYDLETGSVVAQLNQNTVFSGASVMKVAIMLNAYRTIEKFTPLQEVWLRKMIVDSDNYSANSLLAASTGGRGTDDALVGALSMTKMLSEDLGLAHTYQNMPYESSDYLIKVRGVKIKRGPAIEGPAPHTDPDPVLRTTPAEMSSLFLWIEQCRNGGGPLLEKYPNITRARCAEMMTRLEKNGDQIRMRSGLPKGTVVAHKSGWIEDMQSDVGIVRSPGGDFLVAIYVYTDIRPTKVFLTDAIAAPTIGHFARLIYTYYNPVVQ
jgi:Beta-lactamase enzyme family